MTAWPKDNQAARNAFYGDPGKGQIASQMVPVVPPFAMYYDGKRVKAIQFHKKAAPALLAALNEIWDYCGHDQAKVDASGASKYAGAYNHRMVRGSSTKWSNHAYAAAIDLNAGENALGVKKGTMPQFVVDAFCRQGAMWGGWYKSRPDWMHFEFVDNGGHKPLSAHPVFGKPAAKVPPRGVPADEFETHPPLPTFLTKDKPDPVIVDGDVKGDPELYSVQKRLKAMNYNPGALDGVWGGGTSGALSGFINDRGGLIPVPASLDAFNDARDAIKAELGHAETQKFTRPVSAARKSGDAATVAAVAPEVVPVKQNFILTAWASFLAFLTAILETTKGYISAAWDWYTDNSDSGIFTTIADYVGMVPGVVWIVAAAIGLGYIALNSRAGVNKITESVATGARL
jgi:peptidoglycan hydrolase-like protein with peptidoglycan-binding domain